MLTDEDMVELVGQSLGRERKLAREERRTEAAVLQREMSELRGQVNALLLMQGSASKAIVDLPQLDWRRPPR
jgi:hypothetical protein